MIRMGLIGCGQMGRVHLGDLCELKDRLRFTALVDTDAGKVAKAAADFAPDAKQAMDYKDIVDHVDAVLIALPHDLHYDSARFFLEHGKHVLLEKPLALTEQQCVHLVELDKSPNPMLMVGYPLRADPLWIEFGRLMREKPFGECFQVSIWTEQYTDLTRGAWLGQASRLGGGQLFSHGCHYIDQMLLWMGNPVEGTHLGTNLGTPWMEREGTSNVTIKFESGALGYHMGTWGARGSRLKYSVHAHCEKGMLEMQRHQHLIVLHEDRSGGDPHFVRQALGRDGELEKLGPTETVVYRGDTSRGSKAINEQALSFLDHIEQGKVSISPASDSLHSLRVIWRLYEAEQKGVVADLRGLGFGQRS